MDPAVRRLMLEAEIQAERTLARVRIVVPLVLALVVVAFILPFGPTDDPLFRRQMTLAGITVTGYFLVGLMSLRTATMVPEHPWLAWLYVTLDVTFMLASVVLTGSNASLSTSFAAAFPNVWIAPLILALGVLRYDPRLQAWITFLACAGLAVAMVAPDPAPVDETARLGFFFELPPNLVRLTMLALIGGVLVVAALRTRRLLWRAVEETRRREALRRFLPPQVAARLEAADDAGLRSAGRHRLAILFVDIRGFTAMAESMEPALLSELVTGFRARILDAAEQTSGVVDKFIGDAAMILFGVPDPHPQDASRALACAQAIALAIDRWNARRVAEGAAPIRIGMGAHCGESFCGAVGDPRRLEFTVLGDTVNVASRLEALTRDQPWRLVVSAELLEKAGQAPGEPGWTRLPDRPLRGRSGSIVTYGALPVPDPANKASASPSAR